MADHYDIEEIKSRISIADLFTRDAVNLRRSGSSLVARCPFHDEKTPSCHINEQKGTYHCYGCGAGGDILTYWQDSRGLDFKAALPDLAAIAGIGAREYTPTALPKKHLRKSQKPTQPLPDPLTGKPLQDWIDANQSLANNPAEQTRIAQWRGYSTELVAWATARGLIGLYPYYGTPREALLVEMPTPSLLNSPEAKQINTANQEAAALGKNTKPLTLQQSLTPVSTHIRLAPHTKGNEHPKQSWRFSPSGCGSWPFIVGDHTRAKYLFILEGQWDALALIHLMQWHTLKQWPPSVCVIGLRGASSGDQLIDHYQLRPDAIAFAFADADKAGNTWFFKPCRKCPLHDKPAPNAHPRCLNDRCTERPKSFLESLGQKVAAVHGSQPAEPGTDFNDMVKNTTITREDIKELVQSKIAAHSRKPTGPTLLQWCKKNKNNTRLPPGILRGITLIISDTARPKGRKPLRHWQKHWQSKSIPDEHLAALNDTWNAWKHEVTTTTH